MKNYILFLIPVLMMSCGGSDESTENSEEENNNADTTSSEATVDKEIGNFVKFEDYAEIHTRQQMIDAFGKENLENDTSWFAEGTVMFKSTHVRNPETGHKITYVFKEFETDSVNFIETNFQNFNKAFEEEGTQKVESRTGLYTGMPLEELVEWNNGEPIEFSGFGWDYGGGIFPKEGSKLEKSDVNISLSFNPTVAFEGYQDLYGDMELTSSDENLQGAPIIINYMSMFVNDPMDQIEAQEEEVAETK